MTITVPDIEIIEHLDFEVPCRGQKVIGRPEQCNNPATWKSITTCCGFIVLFCDSHHDYFTTTWLKLDEGLPLYCGGCAKWDVVSKEFLRWERL
jgi:hypothetical protein